MVNKKAFKAIMGLCLVMQALILLPHHHHADSESPCVNVIHCFGMNTGEQCSASGSNVDERSSDHKHVTVDAPGHSHGNKQGQCSLEDIEQQRIARDDARQNFQPVPVVFLFLPGFVDDIIASNYFDTIQNICVRNNGGVQPLHTEYIASALQPRAPSFTA